MAATPMPPSSPCLTMLPTGALACWMALGAARRNTSPRQRRSSMEKRNGPVSRVRRKYHSMNRHPATWERAVAAAAPATPKGPTQARSSRTFSTEVASTAYRGVFELPQAITSCLDRS